MNPRGIFAAAMPSASGAPSLTVPLPTLPLPTAAASAAAVGAARGAGLDLAGRRSVDDRAHARAAGEAPPPAHWPGAPPPPLPLLPSDSACRSGPGRTAAVAVLASAKAPTAASPAVAADRCGAKSGRGRGERLAPRGRCRHRRRRAPASAASREGPAWPLALLGREDGCAAQGVCVCGARGSR